MADEVKIITFKEDPNKGFYDLYQMANHWVKLNYEHIKILSGIYHSWEDVSSKYINTEEYRRTIVIRYIGDPIYLNPQECEHLDTEEIIITNPSCIHEGIKVIRCKNCNSNINKIILPIIDHNSIFTPDNNATCLIDGTETGICTMCGKTEKRIIPGSALGHNYVFTNDGTETCTEDGTETGICTRCHDTINRIIPGSKLGHNYIFTFDNNSTCTEDGTETGICSRCGNTINQVKVGSALGHDLPTEWTIRINPTYTTPGLKFKKCTRCDYEITEEIPILEIDLEIISTLSAMLIDQAFSQTLKTNLSDDLSSSVTWNIESGSLPDGLSLNGSTGLLSGTPTSSGIYTFEVKASYNDKSATKSFTVNIANRLCTVTFDAQGGSCSESSKQVAEGSLIGTLPVPTLDGKTFGGWFTAATDGLKIDENYTVSSDTTLYARWGEGSDIEFGDTTTQFNIAYKNDRTNYNNQPYTLYYRIAGGASGTADLRIQTGISSQDKSNNMSDTNKEVKLYMKVTNAGSAGNFDIGFDCDSYIVGNSDDQVPITRLENGVSLGNPVAFTVTVPYDTTIWVGNYNQRTSNRYNNMNVGSIASNIDTGYAFTMNNIFINSRSYVILEVTFKIP